MDAERYHYLQQMGVQVWVPKRPPAEPAVDSLHSEPNRPSETGSHKGSSQAEAILAQLRSNKTNATVSVQSPQLRSISSELELVFLEYEDLSLVYESASIKGKPSSDPKRFCDEVVFAFDSQKSFLQLSSVGCLLSRTGNEPKVLGENNKVLAHLEKSARNCSKCVLFGPEIVRQLYGSDDGYPLYEQAETMGKSMLVVESIGSYLTQPLSKKALWKALLKFR